MEIDVRMLDFIFMILLLAIVIVTLCIVVDMVVDVIKMHSQIERNIENLFDDE